MQRPGSVRVREATPPCRTARRTCLVAFRPLVRGQQPRACRSARLLSIATLRLVPELAVAARSLQAPTYRAPGAMEALTMPPAAACSTAKRWERLRGLPMLAPTGQREPPGPTATCWPAGCWRGLMRRALKPAGHPWADFQPGSSQLSPRSTAEARRLRLRRRRQRLRRRRLQQQRDRRSAQLHSAAHQPRQDQRPVAVAWLLWSGSPSYC